MRSQPRIRHRRTPLGSTESQLVVEPTCTALELLSAPHLSQDLKYCSNEFLSRTPRGHVWRFHLLHSTVPVRAFSSRQDLETYRRQPRFKVFLARFTHLQWIIKTLLHSLLKPLLTLCQACRKEISKVWTDCLGNRRYFSRPLSECNPSLLGWACL